MRSVTTDRTAVNGPRYVCAHCGDVTPPSVKLRRTNELKKARSERCSQTEEMFK